MGVIRDRMIADLELGNYAEGTPEHYVREAAHFAAHFTVGPGRLGHEDIRNYLLHVVRVQKKKPARLKLAVAC
jgi:hypothetical protein